jgi:hypothetical protein
MLKNHFARSRKSDLIRTPCAVENHLSRLRAPDMPMRVKYRNEKALSISPEFTQVTHSLLSGHAVSSE